MRHFAITGTVTASIISMIFWGSLMRATPPAARMSAGTRSRAMTATAPASSAIFACSALTTSMMTPPFSIWASPFFSVQVPVDPLALPDPLDERPGAVGRGISPHMLARRVARRGMGRRDP